MNERTVNRKRCLCGWKQCKNRPICSIRTGAM